MEPKLVAAFSSFLLWRDACPAYIGDSLKRLQLVAMYFGSLPEGLPEDLSMTSNCRAGSRPWRSRSGKHLQQGWTCWGLATCLQVQVSLPHMQVLLVLLSMCLGKTRALLLQSW